MKKKPHEVVRGVSIERDGQRYTGSYTADHRIIEVSYGSDSKTTQIGGSSPNNLAKVLLRELVTEEQARRKQPPRDVSQAEQAAFSIVTRALSTGRELTFYDVEAQLARQGHSRGAIHEAWFRLERAGRTKKP